MRLNEEIIVEKEQELERLRNMDAEHLMVEGEPGVLQVWTKQVLNACTCQACAQPEQDELTVNNKVQCNK